jgi:hypothetical protein
VVIPVVGAEAAARRYRRMVFQTPRPLQEHLAREERLQIRIVAINALDYTVEWKPNVDPQNATFGLINQDWNNPRHIQSGARFTSSERASVSGD